MLVSSSLAFPTNFVVSILNFFNFKSILLNIEWSIGIEIVPLLLKQQRWVWVLHGSLGWIAHHGKNSYVERVGYERLKLPIIIIAIWKLQIFQ